MRNEKKSATSGKVWKFGLVAAVLIGLVLGLNTAQVFGIFTVTGTPTLTISTATAGQEPDEVFNSTSTLTWDKESYIEITVMTNLGSPNFILKVEAIGVSGGTSPGEVIIDTTARILINLTGNGSCTLKYTASAQASDGTGTDSHTIIYTIQ